ncbi:hypothetical protein CkaCkLH20_08386 [Colletotrichum karsti]|uniref:Uncharacterized protein n=1 Tax=Colletotrichum karsti TaxID=1095194 RepID=A0A9P6I0V8_9PEZI|nr:uncharacterized protein CkaCkLH20_08386 [Colletotrichum karsti]KAF9874014.1 hypothetical protein CkaCkLH20_08386 [Colletotrichum karsti]
MSLTGETKPTFLGNQSEPQLLERLLNLDIDFKPEVWRPQRKWDELDSEETEVENRLSRILGGLREPYNREAMLMDAARISRLGTLRDEKKERFFQDEIQPDIVAKANVILNSHEVWDEVNSLMRRAEEEDNLGLSPFSNGDSTEVLRLLQRFTSWQAPNLRFDRYVLKPETDGKAGYSIRGYLRDVLILLTMKCFWDRNQHLEWVPDIHPAAIRQAEDFASKVGKRAIQELNRALDTKLKKAKGTTKTRMFPQSPKERKKLARRFLSGLPKCKPTKVVDHAGSGHRSQYRKQVAYGRQVRFIVSHEDPRKEIKLSPLRALAKQYNLSIHTYKQLMAFMYSDDRQHLVSE